MDPINWRGFERVVIVAGGICFAYFGYRLYHLAVVVKGKTSASAQFGGWKFLVAGAGPGLVFMAMGGFVLISALLKGGASVDSEVRMDLEGKIEAVKSEMKLMENKLESRSDTKRFPTMELPKP